MCLPCLGHFSEPKGPVFGFFPPPPSLLSLLVAAAVYPLQGKKLFGMQVYLPYVGGGGGIGIYEGAFRIACPIEARKRDFKPRLYYYLRHLSSARVYY